MVEHLYCKHKALSSNSSPTKKTAFKPGTHADNPSYSGGRDGSRLAQAKVSKTPSLPQQAGCGVCACGPNYSGGGVEGSQSKISLGKSQKQIPKQKVWG
jgi:hypothetical protein